MQGRAGRKAAASYGWSALLVSAAAAALYRRYRTSRST